MLLCFIVYIFLVIFLINGENRKPFVFHYYLYTGGSGEMEVNMRILVTGGAGFIGSNLCKRLCKEGNYVVCLDNLFTGRYENIKDLIKVPNFKFIKGDVIEPINMEIDQIYNLACPASPIHYQSDPIKTMKTNVVGILNMLDLAKNINAKLLQASTSEIYGDPKIHPQLESYWGNVNPIGIRSCYDEGKRAAEALMMDYYRQHKVQIRIMRIFNTYGPNMRIDDGRVVSNLIVQALKGENLTVYGNGTQTRSFCYIDDLVEGMILLMNSNITQPMNIGNNEEYTILELAKKVKKMTNSNSKIIFKELPKDDPVLRRPNIDYAKEQLGWEPIINIDEGISKTIDYFKKII